MQASPTEKILRAHLCTRAYTTVYTWVYSQVYTRVYSSLLSRRYSLGISRLGHRYFYLRRMLPHDLALALWWFHASALRAAEIVKER